MNHGLSEDSRSRQGKNTRLVQSPGINPSAGHNPRSSSEAVAHTRSRKLKRQFDPDFETSFTAFVARAILTAVHISII